MKRSAFEESNEAEWKELESSLAALEHGLALPNASRLPQLYRKACGDLALAQHRMYGRRLCERLNSLVIVSYQFLHALLRRGGAQFVRFFAATLPQAVRAEYRLVWLSFALFFVPFGAFLLAAKYDPSWIFATLPQGMQEMMDQSYGHGTTDPSLSNASEGFARFAGYILNNVSINFRIFAAGIIFGAGSMFMVGFQGILIGAMFAYVHVNGDPTKLYTFAASHSSWELLGFIIGGAAGMRLGLALVTPGRLTRSAALRAAGKRALPLLYGSMVMISLAAVIEGNFSPLQIPAIIKYTVGIAGWVFFAVYYFFAGRKAYAA
jgi:uncharacterized membrane protein SpoIIM required for sporulation